LSFQNGMSGFTNVLFYFQLCGVWRRVPREYKRLLREGSLYVALVWGDERNNTMDSALSGRINRLVQYSLPGCKVISDILFLFLQYLFISKISCTIS
jgi:hypothetical protein